MVKDKINYRARGPNNQLTRQPVQGRANDGGLRIGEMERDGVMAHGASAFLNDSFMVRGDEYALAVCNKTGAVAIYNESLNLFFSPLVDGPVKFNETVQQKMTIDNKSRFGRTFSIVRIPYSLNLLMHELQVMNVQMRIITEDNVDQLLTMNFSDNIRTLLFKDGEKEKESLEDIIKTYRGSNIVKSKTSKNAAYVVEEIYKNMLAANAKESSSSSSKTPFEEERREGREEERREEREEREEEEYNPKTPSDYIEPLLEDDLDSIPYAPASPSASPYASNSYELGQQNRPESMQMLGQTLDQQMRNNPYASSMLGQSGFHPTGAISANMSGQPIIITGQPIIMSTQPSMQPSMQSFSDNNGHETVYNKEIQSKYDSLSEEDREMLQDMIEKKRRDSSGRIETIVKKMDSEKKPSILDIEEDKKEKEDKKETEDTEEINASSTKKTIRF